MKPWREIATPHTDVLEGTFQQSEFAADITAVHTGRASREYQDPRAFYDRTFITEGMRLLLTSVARRLNGKGGDPVIQLQTAFGGGKTHTMLAVYHLARRSVSLSGLPGVSSLLDAAGVMDVPRARVVVLDGSDRGPGQARKYGKQKIHTLWGELAWQLGGEEGFELVKEADGSGTSPGKETLRVLLENYAPCVTLIDELVAYIRQFSDSKRISGGTFDSNLSFVQALTEATKLVPNAVLLATLPESEVEAGSSKGVSALRALEKTFGRIHALWKPVATEEAFEIVRQRLFDPVQDESGRDEVCRAFASAYVAEGAKLPSETQESRYQDRMRQSYPIHPEVFDRLYEDWTTIDGFQRTRGVLKLMAKVIYRLWKDQNKDYMILPGSIPLYDGETRNELLYYLQAGWDPVLERDIDGERAETTEMENREPRFGSVHAARRVARTVFLGTAPSAVAMKPSAARGLTRPRILLGCQQPEQSSALYTDALGRLSDTLHYLNSNAERGQDTARFWFDTRANLRREMEERKRRFDNNRDVRPKIAEVVRRLCGSINLVDGLHVFTPNSDVPDDSALRLVVLPPEKFYNRRETRLAFGEVCDFIRKNGEKPRYRGNRLLFLAPDHDTLSRLDDATKRVLAWQSILNDVQDGRLNIDREQENQAKRELQGAEDVLPRVVRECFRWLLCPYMNAPTDRDPTVEAFALNPSGTGVGPEVERICSENELVITFWSPIHLRDSVLKQFYWKRDRNLVNALAVWEDMQRYCYLPRLRDRHVFEQTISQGVASKDFFGTAYGEHDGKFDGFGFGDVNIQVDDTLLLIEPEAAGIYRAAQTPAPTLGGGAVEDGGSPGIEGGQPTPGTGKGPEIVVEEPKTTSFHGAVDIDSTIAKMKMAEVADEIIQLLTSDPNATLRVTLEIAADFPDGASDQIKRAVSENANSLGFKSQNWE